jgi:hypothetical protein
VLLIDEGTFRTDTMATGLRDAGYDVTVVQQCSIVEMKNYIEMHKPDVLMYEDGNVVDVAKETSTSEN